MYADNIHFMNKASSIFKVALIALLSISSFSITSCLKESDPPGASVDPNLKDFYCNDPRAINYNWNFPGIPNDSICIYPIDLYEGQWILNDSIFFTDKELDTFLVNTVQFEKTEDSLLIHLSLKGLCNNDNPIFITTDKFGNAEIDSMDIHNSGQLFCMPEDTITGTFRFQFDNKDTLEINMEVRGPNARIHKAKAFRFQ